MKHNQLSSLWVFGLICLLTVIVPAQASTYSVIYTFTGGADGGVPDGGALLLDSAGNMYGTTSSGGTYNQGTVFKLTPNADGTWNETVLHTFHSDGVDGAYPSSGVIFDQAGNLYGTAAGGGLGDGAVYELTPNADGSWTEKVLYSFKGGSDGAGPLATPMFDSAGNLFGTTWGEYPSSDFGTVFELLPNADGTWTEKVLYAFTGGADGGNPNAVIMDTSGKLYSTTQWGGTGICNSAAPACGTVFSLTPNADGSWTERVLHSFSGIQDGENPISPLVFDGKGRMFSTARYGGKAGGGTVFELAPRPNGKWAGRVIYQFANGVDTASPHTGLLVDRAGNLYGAADGGGSYGYGTVYQLRLDTKGNYSETILHSFSDADDGSYPHAPVIMNPAGKLYGTAAGGGAYGNGVVFEITP